MADTTETDAELDPALRTILENHQRRMAQIFQDGYETSKAIAEESVTLFKQRSGVRSQVLDKALQMLSSEKEV